LILLKFDKIIPETDKWEDIVSVLHSQNIGVWLAPYTNNIRICFYIENMTKNNLDDMKKQNLSIIRKTLNALHVTYSLKLELKEQWANMQWLK